MIAGSFGRDTDFGATTLAGPSPFFNFTANSFVACLSAAGAWRWATSARTPGSRGSRASSGGIATGVAVAPTGEVLVTGNFRDTLTFGATTLLTSGRTYEAYVARLSATGAWQWAVATAGSTGTGGFTGPNAYDYTRGTRIGIDAAGNALVTGYFARGLTLGTLTLSRRDTIGTDPFVAKLNPAGVWMWATTISRPTTWGANLNGLLVDAAGNLLLTGSVVGPVTLGSITLTSPPGLARAYVAKLSAAGTWLWASASDGGGNAQMIDGGLALAVDAAGQVLVAGYAAHVAPGIPYNSLPLVAKLSSTGAWGWRATGSVNSPRDYAVCFGLGFTPAGDVQVAGLFKGTTTLGTTSITSLDSGSVFIATLTNGPLATPTLLAAAPPLSVWPNPAHQTATIRTQADELVEVLDAQGRVVRACPRGAAGVTADRLLDVRGLAPGLYLVRAGAATRRLVVE
ncbi:MAG: T9SS type A sorting domain-containing protein [Hymenobacteraceae bacterium]|nr:T9SS type A sorting domain-containing protein [Hymenobacteraceae bacterium]